MTQAGIDYIRGLYQTAIAKKAEAKTIKYDYSRGHLVGYHSSTIDLCESIAQIERFSLTQAGEGKQDG